MSVPLTSPASAPPERSRFWRTVVADGSAPLPRWTSAPRPGRAVLDRGPDGELAAGLRALSGQTGASLSEILLAAHVKVVSVLTGEHEVLVGHVVRAHLLPCRATVAPGSWDALLADVLRVAAALDDHGATPPDAPSVASAVASVVEVVHGPVPAWAPEGTPTVPLWLRFDADTGRLELTYDTAAVDADHAGRILGYHVRALELLRDHGAPGRPASHLTSLLSAQERELQLTGLGGPRRELPDRRLHQLFEHQARRVPDRVAAVQGDRRWSYAELNAAANRVAHSLVSAGASTEDVVAVVTDRNLEWMATVLGVLKAGAVYLPIEPRFPAARIEWMLDRARVRTVVTERAHVADVPGGRHATLVVEDLLEGGASERDPDIPVGAGQAAYIYFTSGSTGEPKGALCEHGGLLNHVLAKIEDLGIGDGCVVAQTAPQCFDISLWQLVAAPAVGGCTVIVEQTAILDALGFLDAVEAERIEVVQVVPAYLEVLLTHLEDDPREFPHLRRVCATGEALKPGLVARWFAAYPAIPLVNAYGLTETCDDTNHETLHEAPGDDLVPLGRPVNNVAVYVVDDGLDPVPLGSTGEIVFSGVCVARGYVNDPERTRLAFCADPHRPGARLYRSGDYGRWLPGGKLEFRGRRDAQIKIRGFRVEIGEIENRMLEMPAVRDAAVVVVGAAGAEPALAGFATAPGSDAADIRRRLAGMLPDYMVPTSVHLLDVLPVTANGKVDRVELTRLALSRAATGPRPPARLTPGQERLARVWAEVLGTPVEEIGPATDFFTAGGTSLSAVRLVVALERAVSVADVRESPVLADLTALLGSRSWGPLRTPEPSV